MIAVKRTGNTVTVWSYNDERVISIRSAETTVVEKYGNSIIANNSTGTLIRFEGEYAEIRLKVKGITRVESSRGVFQFVSGDSAYV